MRQNVTFIQENTRSINSVSECPQRSDLADKDFKKFILNMFKELKETMRKELN